MKRLIMMRQAKSDSSQGGLMDFEHPPLSKRGVKYASKMGKWMATELELPEIVLCSTARHTHQTKQLLLLARQAADIGNEDIEQIDLDTMYLASVSTLKKVVLACG